MSQTSFPNNVWNVLQSREARTNTKTSFLTVIILIIWLGLVIYTESHHEFWRDEVRALSLAQDIQSPADFYALLKYEGHPLLWYVLLFIGTSLINTPVWLPVLAVAIAFTAVSIFMFNAPFPLWSRLIFIFGAFSVYEYAVMARNYGLSMLLLFLIAVLYRQRFAHPYRLAWALFFLANTNVHSLILVGLICLIWTWNFFRTQCPISFKQQWGALYLPLLVVLGGILLSLVYVFPKQDSILVSNSLNLEPLFVIKTFIRTILQSDTTFTGLFPASFPGWITVIILPLIAVGLIRRPPLMLAAFGAQIMMGLTFLMIYSGKFRHQGLYVVFIIFLYWIFLDSFKGESLSGISGHFFKIGFSALTILLIGNLLLTPPIVTKEINTPASASKQFGEFLSGSPRYQNAIILPEPDYMMESLPYYADNSIYFPREDRFGKTVSWADDGETFLSLGELIAIGEDLKAAYNQEILIAIGHWDIDLTQPGEEVYSYNKVFHWDAAELTAFQSKTELVIEFTPAFTGEKYRVYRLK